MRWLILTYLLLNHQSTRGKKSCCFTLVASQNVVVVVTSSELVPGRVSGRSAGTELEENHYIRTHSSSSICHCDHPAHVALVIQGQIYLALPIPIPCSSSLLGYNVNRDSGVLTSVSFASSSKGNSVIAGGGGARLADGGAVPTRLGGVNTGSGMVGAIGKVVVR